MKAGSIGYQPEQHPTLRAGSNLASTRAVIALQSDGSTSTGSNGNESSCDGSTYTLNCVDRQSVAIACNQRSEVRLDGGDGNTVGTIPATRSGKQLQGVLCMATGQANAEILEDSAPTLNASHEQPICVADDNSMKYADRAVGPLCARDFKGVGNEYVAEGKLVVQVDG